ncbi:sigma-54-dependent Fis family transcriptional regulator [Ammoniphilus sp. CFH 90114]|uniref:sigma-54 interaction domain-containing protein n=1 Tax=Ammoniphilus sp. CFH 90114 TaxID=2493665 RepID=UPI00100F2F14|nr:sigma 54-interacting transcriptional regulator [Ammoniphilus sp. CFH 90114]RXT06360.1 AAA family ATPase [Ammoniphilus sp. CFH 90114]
MKIKQEGWVHRLLRSLNHEVNKSNKELDLYRTALEHAYEGIIIVDRDGYIQTANETYASFVGQDDVNSLIGKHVTEVVENTRMHIVAKTGQAEIADLQLINGHQMIAHRLPVIVDGEVVAVVGKIMFQDIDDLFAMNSKFSKLYKELDNYKNEGTRRIGAKYSFDHIVGQSSVLEKVKKLGKKVAKSDTTVLLKGESGTGKELFAHAIHRESLRANGPFIRVNCAAIPEALFESELFGYKEGSFTGAKRSGKKGKFALAYNGTIFLDEISEMPLSMQVKLLRVLQEKEIEPVGAESPEPIDVRIIAASNKDLEVLVEQGLFREDLYYRLNVLMIEIPPLRERKEDIPLLVDHILNQLRLETRIQVDGIEEQAMQIILNHPFPGNIRELRNLLERSLYVKESNEITATDLPPNLFRKRMKESTIIRDGSTLQEIVEQVERDTILKILKLENGNKLLAAKRLGVSKSSFYAKLDKYQISE